MAITRTVAALLLTQTLAAPGFAQEATSAAEPSRPPSAATSEFGRASGGALEIAVKSPSRLSGSLGIALPFLSGHGGKRNAATLGGTVVRDRLWFFATAEQMESPRFSAPAGGFETSVNAALDERHSLGAALRAGRELVVPQSSTPPLAVPSSFLSLRYTGIVSSNMFFTATVTRSSRQQAPTPFGQPQ